MLKIDRRFVVAVNAAQSPADLYGPIQGAIQLEHSTIPPYLTALLSLKPGANVEIARMLRSIVIDEMLHMTIACNLLNALGGQPKIDDPAFVPRYPGPLPMGINQSLQVGLEPFSLDLVKNTFMQIEAPKDPISFPIKMLALVFPPSFATIGEFYQALIGKIQELSQRGNSFKGDAKRQVTTPYFPDTRLFPITDAQSAIKELQLIVEEGEGTSLSPLQPGGQIAHYYRFEGIYDLKELKPDQNAPKGFSFSKPIPFDSSGVYPLTKNQKLADLDAASAGGQQALKFAKTYTQILKALQQSFDGNPGQLDTAIGLMTADLKQAGQALCALPAVKNGTGTGLNAGPTFEYVR